MKNNKKLEFSSLGSLQIKTLLFPVCVNCEVKKRDF